MNERIRHSFNSLGYPVTEYWCSEGRHTRLTSEHLDIEQMRLLLNQRRKIAATQ